MTSVEADPGATFEASLGGLIRHVRDVVVPIDEQGTILYANAATRGVLGYSPAEVVGRNVSEFVHVDELSIAAADLLELLGGQHEDIPSLYRVRHADGSWRYVEASASVASGIVPGAVAVLTLHDATDRVLAEAKIRDRLEFEDLVARITAPFVSGFATEFDKAVDEALREIGVHTMADHAFVFIVDQTDGGIDNTHEWFAPGVEPEVETRRRLRLTVSAETLKALLGGMTIVVGDVSLLDDTFALEREQLEAGAVTSIAVAPMRLKGLVIGFVGIDSTENRRSFDPGDAAVLQSAAGILAHAFSRHEAEQRYRGVIRHSPLPTALYDSEGYFIEANGSYLELTGRSTDQLEGSTVLDILAADEHAAARRQFDDLRRGLVEVASAEMVCVRPDAGTRLVAARSSAVRDRRGRVKLLIVHAEDITERRRAETSLRHSEARFRSVFDNSPAIFTRLDRHGDLLFANQALADLAGRPIAKLLGRNVREIGLDDEDERCWLDSIERVLLTRQRDDFEWSIEQRDGTRSWFQTRIVPDHSPEQVPLVLAMTTDITQLKKIQADLVHQATHDDLTGLRNRQALLEDLEDALAQCRDGEGSPALLFLDLDRFKVINDSLGHAAGDQLLVVVARRLSSVLRESEIVARLGGDEFVVLLKSLVGIDSALVVAERLRRVLAAPMTIHGQELYATASIGVALSNDQLSSTDLLRQADAAMYLAKERGRDRTEVYEAHLHAAASRRLRAESELRHALDNHELRVHYQPEIELEDGTVTGVEALVRWHHPTDGLRRAADFIGIAEDTGLIIDLGGWVLREACGQGGIWYRRQPSRPLTVRVNLSARQIGHPDLVKDVADALTDGGLPPEHLCLEITETALMADAAAVLEVLEDLRSLGLQLAVDDFGTGYSSLSYLKRLPVDVLKIDRSFVHGIGVEAHDTAIARAIVDLARSLGLSTIGEGVETPEQLAALRQMGCCRAQGFHICPPCEADEIEFPDAAVAP
ncbi:MAG: hypothetical protein JJLCMIEE_01862 [Acidimicrobiales bacterium]|nr:MAG: EAL domain-containing protein [Actinomycetota bacterium]MBV6508796.1 hypothetical protein [Acidimicrobiales bacterium]